jgi:hypothetical protein
MQSTKNQISKRRTDRQKILFWIIFCGVILIRLWLITGIPKLIIFGPHDDLFYARAAQSILRGHWMGRYDHFTLIKGPFYAFFLIGSFITGLSLYFTETILYVGACVILFFALKPLINNRWIRFVGFVVLLFVPSSLPIWFHLRVYREFVYFSLTLLVTGFALGLFLRVSDKPKSMIIWALGLGFSMGAFMLTREEGVWIYPILLLLLLSGLIMIFVQRRVKKLIKSFILIMPVILWYLPIIIISWLNYVNYGFWGVSETLDRDFNRVLNTMARIEVEDEWHPAIQISEKQRQAAYDISPTLAEYSETIERYVISYNPADDGMMSLKPEWYLEEYGNGGSELGAGHFLWLFRDVFAHNGQFRHGYYPRETFQNLADELEQACQDEDINCRRKSIFPAVISTIDQRHYPIIFRMVLENIYEISGHADVLIQSMNISKSWPKFTGGVEDRLVFEQFAYNPIDPIEAVTNENIPAVIYGVKDFRYRIIQYKEMAMDIILMFYQLISRPLFFFGIIAWFALIILKIAKQDFWQWFNNFVISTFVFGLFFTRLLTLTIIDATSSIPGIKYGASIHIFVPLFSFLVLHWGIENIKEIITARSTR